MDRLILHKAAAKALQPGEWTSFGVGLVDAACPTCGQVCSFHDHSIADNGDVMPSVICPFNCGFHKFVTLQEWRPVSRGADAVLMKM